MTTSNRLALAGVAALPMLGCKPDAQDCSAEFDAVELPPGLPDNGSNPTLLEARWIANDVLELQFSEALEPLTPIDPIDTGRFRVMGWNISTDGSSPYTYYGYGNSNDDCTLYTRYYPVRQTSRSVIDDLWQAPEDAAILRIHMSAAVSCTTPDNPLTGLMLVYTNDPLDVGNASVRDLDGNQLPDIGPAWAISAMDACASYYSNPPSGYYYYYTGTCSGLRATVTGTFPILSSLFEIPCPNDA